MSNNEGSGEPAQASAQQPTDTPKPWIGSGLIRWRVGLVCVGLGVAGWFADPWIREQTRSVQHELGGDLRRELELLQQFGGAATILITAIIVWLLDPARRRRLLDLIGAAVCTGFILQLLKMGIGRPRPKFEDPGVLLWPWGAYPILKGDGGPGSGSGVYHAWEMSAPIHSDLWSMPSSHTSAAVALAVWLGVVYPKLRPLVIGWVGVVGVSRVLLGAHYFSDVLVGAGIGFVVAHAAVRGYWGVRFLDWIWVSVVNRKAKPALPSVLETPDHHTAN